MKNVCKFRTLILMMFAVTVCGFAQQATSQKPATTTQNLVRGVIGPVSSNNNWSNYSIFNIIPGSSLFPLSSSSTVFYYGFTAGSEADISNMVLYTTPRASLTISAVTPVTLGGISNPSIDLASTSVCPVQPLSATSPCIVRFDPTTITLSPASDYYLTVYYTNDSNNQNIGAANANYSQTSLGACYTGGDETHLTVGQSLPRGACYNPIFLMYVMNN
jgi:hypothetical protein